MIWKALGFKNDPFTTDPVIMDTLEVYTGHEKELNQCKNVLMNGHARIVVEGARGVGTTSFCNKLRFQLHNDHVFFTPRNEIRVEVGWTLEKLLSVIVANIVREIELFSDEKLTQDKRFENAKALSMRIAETYRSFGVSALGFGANYGKNAGVVTQPSIVPAAVLGHHLEDLAALVKSFGYQNGILLQLNNLDVGEIHDPASLKILFNALRDYAQTAGISWMFVGDVGIRKFIAQNVDRLDDIISFEVYIEPVSREVFQALINKRVNFYKNSDKTILPIDMSVFLYLYDVTKGRLRYIFGLIARLSSNFELGEINDKISLDIAKKGLVELAKDRLRRKNVTKSEEELLILMNKLGEATPKKIALNLGKSQQYIGKALTILNEKKLLNMQKEGTSKKYTPTLDVKLAYSE